MRPAPLERHALARPFLQRRAKGRDRLLEPRRPVLPLPESFERVAEVVLRHRPVEGNPLTRPLLKRRTIGGDRLLEPRGPTLPLTKRFERIAKIGLHSRPLERNPLARPFLQPRAKSRDRFFEPRRPAFPLAELRQRCAEIVLRRRPIVRLFGSIAASGHRFENLYCFMQSSIVAEFIAKPSPGRWLARAQIFASFQGVPRPAGYARGLAIVSE